MQRLIEWILELVKSWSSPAPTPDKPPVKPPAVPFLPDIARRLVEIHNANRSTPLEVNGLLMKAAQDHAAWMAENRRMSHRGFGFSTPGQRIKLAGYQWSTYGENVAYGQETPEQVMSVWLRSPGHRRNIKSEAYREIGVGYATSLTGRIYWCVTFGSRTFGIGSDDWDESMATPEWEQVT